MSCGAKIRPFPNELELTCEGGAHNDDEQHFGIVRDYAWPGSETKVSWHESDRRNFRGEWAPCDYSENNGVLPCILPLRHRGNHAF